MAQTFSKVILSGSTQGKNIKIAATATLGTTVHTAIAGTSSMDEVWVWATNTETTARKLTIEWGEAAAPDGNIEMTIPAESGPVLVIPGWLLQNGLVITAFSAAANTTVINGYVNRITVS
jgi:hypothetical protein